MLDIITDTLLDSLKLMPFLFIAFLIMEYLEHKLDEKTKKSIEKSGKYGPIIGSIVGSFPQCGFAAAATNLYAARVITIGTLVAVYLSTSDEMLPIMLSENIDIKNVLIIILIKIVIGMLVGIIIDLIIRKQDKHEHVHEFCDDEHCDCEHGIFKSSLKHTINITLFILLINFVLNIIMTYFGQDLISQIFMKDSIFSPLLTSLIGLIPNCAASVIITELYINSAINFGSLIAGLLTGSGIGLLLLFKVNKDYKENIKILIIIYSVGVISGIIINLLGMTL